MLGAGVTEGAIAVCTGTERKGPPNQGHRAVHGGGSGAKRIKGLKEKRTFLQPLHPALPALLTGGWCDLWVAVTVATDADD